MKGSKKQSQSNEFSVPGVDLGQLERLLSFMSEHGLEEFEYAHGDLRIRLKKALSNLAAAPPLALPAAQATAVAPVPPGPVSGPPEANPAASEPGSAAPPAAAPAPAAVEDLHIIKSPIVGTFYAAPNPESEPFVKVGDHVEAGKTVCIIEAMKLMNEIEADVAGEVTRLFVENGQPVEYGEPLFGLRPSRRK